MKKLLVSLTLGMAILLPFIFTSCETVEGLQNEEYVVIEENEDYLTTNITYPQFSDMPALSNRIKNTVENGWKNFKVNAQRDWNEISSLNRTIPPFEYMVKTEVSGSGDIVSVYLNTYLYAGGAHGETFITTINYNKATGKEVNIQEVSGYSYEELVEISKKQIYDLISKHEEKGTEAYNNLAEMIETGLTPYSGTFQSFTVKGNNLYIYFDPYTVLPHNFGVITVKANLK